MLYVCYTAWHDCANYVGVAPGFMGATCSSLTAVGSGAKMKEHLSEKSWRGHATSFTS